MRCQNCNSENPEGMNFCGKCGSPLKSIDAERRHLTVLFCDLVGSTLLSEALDPEELREVVRAYQAECAEVIRRFEGHIAQYLGDGLLVYFGYPMAHEDDAHRAVRAALGIVEAMGNLNASLERERNIRLAVRMGIHSGLVVVGEMGAGGRREQLALGETPNLAARLQSLAEPDTVVISGATHRLIHALFECRDLGAQTVKGVGTPVRVYSVLGESAVRTPGATAVKTLRGSLVGREREEAYLWSRWEEVQAGTGRVVLISGEAGIGKSRLVEALREQLAGEKQAWLECHCSPYHQSSAFQPLIEMIQGVAELRREDSSEQKLQKLERTLSDYDLPLPEVVPVIASLLALPLTNRYPRLTLTPQRLRQKTLQTMLAFLRAVARKHPVLFLVEDLHWADPSTVECINLIVEQDAPAPILTLLTFRPDFRPPWPARPDVSSISLHRLDARQAEAIVASMTDGRSVPAEVLQQVVAKTDGVPLFVEELTKMVLESGLLRKRNGHYELQGPLPPLAIPATLQGSLTARLDRLGAVKEVVQLGATLGREFTYELLRAVSPLDDTVLQRDLDLLVEAELLLRQGPLPHTKYSFKHALIQEAAYESLLRSRRQHYHSRTARVLEERFPEIAQTQPEILAYHYTKAGLNEPAVSYWLQAGRRAVQRSANSEAISSLTKGIELVKTLPDAAERNRQELMLQAELSAPLIAARGYGHPEVEQACLRARELSRQVGETPQLFSVLLGLLAYYLIRGELHTARELGEELIDLGQRLQNSALVLEARVALGFVLFYLGDLTLAWLHIEQGMRPYDPNEDRSHVVFSVFDPWVASRRAAALILWLQGHPEQALRSGQEAVHLAHELSHYHNLAAATAFLAVLHQYRREPDEVLEHAERLLALSHEQAFPFWLAWGSIMRNWAMATKVYPDEGVGIGDGVEGIRESLSAYEAAGIELWGPFWRGLLAEAYAKGGRLAEALAVLTEAVFLVRKNGERWWEPELFRLKGNYILAISPERRNEVESAYRQALHIARRQVSRSLELRTAMSLARFLKQEGKREEAHQTLVEVYNSFNEGLDTADLKDAKTLLEELSKPPTQPDGLPST